VFSIIISFIAFGKSVSQLHLLGGLLFTGSVVLGVHIKRVKTKAKNDARKSQKDGTEEEYQGGGGV
jgi:drug/metabolite transporter (DMT)-like permease